MTLKSCIYKDTIYPSDFNDDDKFDYDKLMGESKIIHPEIYEKEKWIIELAIIAHIRSKKGVEFPVSDEELTALKDRYTLKEREIICKGDEHPYLYDKENNPIFKVEAENNSNIYNSSDIAVNLTNNE